MGMAAAKKIETSIMDQDISQLKTSIAQAQVSDDPYRHYILSDLFDSQLVDDILDMPFEPLDLDYTSGSREEFNPVRRYLNPEAIASYPAAERVANTFLSPDVIAMFEEQGGISLKGSLLRIEYAIDKDKFWLKPHTDIGAKLFTILIYLSKDADASGWGTDIYHDENHYHSTVSYETNTALLFYPTDKTWHGFEPRIISGVRKTLIVNYVKPEWRNRQELVHPTQFVY